MGSVLVIGSGIVGLSCAHALLAAGHTVSVLDRDPAGDKASFGNAGGIGITEIIPASVPGVLWRIPYWLLDPLGPLSIRPAHFPSMLPFFWRFMKAGRRKELNRIACGLAQLHNEVYGDLIPLVEELGLSSELHRVGAIAVYESSKGFERDRPLWDLRRCHGFRCEPIDGRAARDLEPALGPIVRHGIWIPDWSHLDDPKRLVDALLQNLIHRGVKILTGDAKAIEGKAVATWSGERHPFETLVIAGGAWSARLAKTIDERAVLESERGYNTTLPMPKVNLTREVIFAERQFVATPLGPGLRIGGAAEFAGLEAPPNFKRSHALVELARFYLPGLDAADGTCWMGHRPTTPDSLPVIGPSTRRGDIFYAFGHGHTGVTLGPTTGRLIADLVARKPMSLDLTPFDIARFN